MIVKVPSVSKTFYKCMFLAIIIIILILITVITIMITGNIT